MGYCINQYFRAIANIDSGFSHWLQTGEDWIEMLVFLILSVAWVDFVIAVAGGRLSRALRGDSDFSDF